MTRWPKREDIDQVLKDLDDKPWSVALPADATEKDRIKYGLCAEFVKYMNQHKITQRELAKRIGTDEALVSKVVHYYIEEFSLDRLYDFLNALDSSLTLKVARKEEEAA